MVLVMVNSKHNEITIKQRIAWGRRERRTSTQSFSVSNKAKRTRWKTLQTSWQSCTQRLFLHRHSGRKANAWMLKNQSDPMKSRSDNPEAVHRIREIRREAGEAGHEIDPAILRSLQFDNDQNNGFQKYDTWNHLLQLLGGDHVLQILGGPHQTGESTERKLECYLAFTPPT